VLARVPRFFAVNDDDYLLLSPQPPVDSNRELRKVVAPIVIRTMIRSAVAITSAMAESNAGDDDCPICRTFGQQE
jgi:hypothetical protein